MGKITVPVKGLHCKSCEMLVEEKLSEIAGVEKVKVSAKTGQADIYYGSGKPSAQVIGNAVREAGYAVGEQGKKTLLSGNPEDYKDLGIAVIFLAGAYVILKNFGLMDVSIGSVADPSSLSVVFLVGIAAGLSTCMALVGGLILGISARHSEKHPEASPMRKFRPHLFFNLGRVGGYALLGGLLGALGGILQLSGLALGLLTVAVGIVMLVLGLKLVGIFPRISNGGLSLPKSVSRFFGLKDGAKEYSHLGSSLTGALTFFLPCGFTQAMQLYAVSTGSFTQGALVMGVFALGTAPGLLGIGALASAVKGIFARRFFKFSGILVISLALFNIANGYNLTGWQVFTTNQKPQTTNSINDPNVKMENGVQVVSMREISSGYSPNRFTVKKGVPVKWVIDAQAPYSCASSLVVPSLNIRKTLKMGSNVIEFTPVKAGKIPFSCSMGMYTGSFNVVE